MKKVNVSFWLTEDELNGLDKAWRENGYKNRSHFIRQCMTEQRVPKMVFKLSD